MRQKCKGKRWRRETEIRYNDVVREGGKLYDIIGSK